MNTKHSLLLTQGEREYLASLAQSRAWRRDVDIDMTKAYSPGDEEYIYMLRVQMEVAYDVQTAMQADEPGNVSVGMDALHWSIAYRELECDFDASTRDRWDMRESLIAAIKPILTGQGAR